jgi:hypothetical protein
VSSPQTYCTGPCLIFVGVGDDVRTFTVSRSGTAVPGTAEWHEEPMTRTVRYPGTNPVLLGTCEAGPRIVKRPRFREWHTSRRADVPETMIFTGEDALIFAPVNWYDESVYARICARPFRNAPRGRIERGAEGTLMKEEGETYKLWLAFPYSTKINTSLDASAPAGPGGFGLSVMKNMPAGYRYPNAYLLGPDVLDPLGSQARLTSLVFHAVLEEETEATKRQLYETLYDHNMTELIGYNFAA